RLRVGLDPPGRLAAVEYRQLDVHEDQVGPLRPGRGAGLRTVGGVDHRVAPLGQAPRQHVAVVLVVFDQKDLGHRRSPPFVSPPASGREGEDRTYRPHRTYTSYPPRAGLRPAAKLTQSAAPSGP